MKSSSENTAESFSDTSASVRRSARSTKGRHSRFEREDELIGGHDQSPVPKKHNQEAWVPKTPIKANSRQGQETDNDEHGMADGDEEQPIEQVENPTILRSSGRTKSKKPQTAASTPAAKKKNSAEKSEEPAKTRPKGRGRGRHSNKAEEEAEDDDEKDEGIVACICGATDDDGELMAECETCLKWQHSMCMLEIDDADDLPDHYYCHDCRPDLYPNIETLKKNALENMKKPKRRRRKSGTKKANTTITPHSSSSTSVSATAASSSSSTTPKTTRGSTNHAMPKPDPKSTKVATRMSARKRKLSSAQEADSENEDDTSSTAHDQKSVATTESNLTSKDTSADPDYLLDSSNSKRVNKKQRSNGVSYLFLISTIFFLTFFL